MPREELHPLASVSINAADVIQSEARYLVPTYTRAPIVFARGEGSYVYDTEGKSFLDFCAGIAVTALGHGDPTWVEILSDQATRLTHVSNLFHTVPHVELAEVLAENSFADRAFFANSGAEANEAALKFARKWARTRHSDDKADIVAFSGGFHGRTMGALSLTEKQAYRAPFAPLVPGVTFATFNDLEAVEGAISEHTCAVFVEPIQGEAGVHPADSDFLLGLRQLCDQRGALLVFDEIQCGLGRTGQLWAHEVYDVRPDIMTLAKPLAGGLPIGVTLVTEEVSRAIEIGDHGSTFGAGPLVCRSALSVFDRIRRKSFLDDVADKGVYLQEELRSLSSDQIAEVRGVGLLVGVQLKQSVKPLIEIALEKGLVLIGAGEEVLRICPPLTITVDEIGAGIEILKESLSDWDSKE